MYTIGSDNLLSFAIQIAINFKYNEEIQVLSRILYTDILYNWNTGISR